MRNTFRTGWGKPTRGKTDMSQNPTLCQIILKLWLRGVFSPLPPAGGRGGKTPSRSQGTNFSYKNQP